jgi:hypothetical protein
LAVILEKQIQIILSGFMVFVQVLGALRNTLTRGGKFVFF